MAVARAAMWNRLITIIINAEEAMKGRIEAHLRNPSPSRKEQVQDLTYVKSILASLDAQIPTEVFPVVEMAYNESEAATLKVPGVDLFPVVNNVGKIRRDAVNILADNATHRLGDAAQTIGRRTDDVFRRHGLRAAAARALEGEAKPLAMDTELLASSLRKKGIQSFEDRGGRLWELHTYAEMVIKTTTAEAHNRAVINSMLARGLDLVVVRHTNPHHDEEADPKDPCLAYAGKVFSLTGKTPGYPVLDKIPPFHPNCDHFLMPAKEGLVAITGLEAVAA